MRVDDYRFYGKISLIFGIVLLVIGILLPVLTTTWYPGWLTGSTYYDVPYYIGLILIVISQILSRAYRPRMQKTKLK